MKLTRVFAFMAMAGLATSAFATNGYFSHGYGIKAKGMGGAATASTDDAFFGANNPAAAAFVGNRLDLGVDVFSPTREASRTGLGPLDMSVESDSNYFFIPEFGYNRMINNDWALGITVYGNGGMNTDYPGGQIDCGQGPANMLCGSGSLGVDLMQLMIAPTVAFKLAPNHSIGVAPLIGYQRFAAEGLQAFGVMTPSGGNIGTDDSWGFGVRVGYLGKITPTVTIGAAYASKMSMDEFDDYAGLFAEQGDFDIPENYNLGVSWQATPQLRLAMDYQRINYSGVDSIANPSSNLFNCINDPSFCLGGDNGPGFGWSDIDVWKLGIEYKHNQAWTYRAGYNHGDNPISSSDVTFNILAPGVVQDHVTLGFTNTLQSGDEWSMGFMYAFNEEVSGASLLPALQGGSPAGTETIEMYQWSLGVQYSWKM